MNKKSDIRYLIFINFLYSFETLFLSLFSYTIAYFKVLLLILFPHIITKDRAGYYCNKQIDIASCYCALAV